MDRKRLGKKREDFGDGWNGGIKLEMAEMKEMEDMKEIKEMREVKQMRDMLEIVRRCR